MRGGTGGRRRVPTHGTLRIRGLSGWEPCLGFGHPAGVAPSQPPPVTTGMGKRCRETRKQGSFRAVGLRADTSPSCFRPRQGSPLFKRTHTCPTCRKLICVLSQLVGGCRPRASPGDDGLMTRVTCSNTPESPWAREGPAAMGRTRQTLPSLAPRSLAPRSLVPSQPRRSAKCRGCGTWDKGTTPAARASSRFGKCWKTNSPFSDAAARVFLSLASEKVKMKRDFAGVRWEEGGHSSLPCGLWVWAPGSLSGTPRLLHLRP